MPNLIQQLLYWDFAVLNILKMFTCCMSQTTDNVNQFSMPLCIVNIPLIYWSVCSYNVTSPSILLLIWYNKDIEDIDGATIFSRCDFTSTSTQKRILTVLPSSGADVIMRYIKTIMECKKRRKILNGNTSLYTHVEYLC